MPSNQDSGSLDQGDETTRRGTEVLSYGEQAVERGDEVLLASDPTVKTEQESDPHQSRTRGEAQPEIEVQCGTPRDVAPPVPGGSYNRYRSALGSFAEKMIVMDFCDQTNCQPFLQPNSRNTDYFDNRGGANLLIAFLSTHNSHLTDADRKKMLESSVLKDGLKRPDILTHKSERRDYYEIKPNSRSGLRDGQEKLEILESFMARFNLPYELGTAYTPSHEIEIGTVDVEGIPIEVFLRVERLQPALLAYKFCMRGELKEANRRLGSRMRKIALLGFIIGSIVVPIPRKDPIDKQPPVEDQPPIEDPIKIPAAGAQGFADRTIVIPKPYQGPIAESSITGNYVRGLPRDAAVGEMYPIVISYESQGRTYYTVIQFRVDSAGNNNWKLISTNRVPLDVAPTGHEPQILDVRTELNITWTRRN